MKNENPAPVYKVPDAVLLFIAHWNLPLLLDELGDKTCPTFTPWGAKSACVIALKELTDSIVLTMHARTVRMS